MRRGTIVWVEIPVRDLKRAADFYTGLFGWSFESNEDSDHWIFTPPGRGAMGAITTARPLGPGGAKIGVAVDDVQLSTNVAIKLGGGTAGEPAEVSVGKAAEVVDPDGNHLWLYQSEFSASAASGRDTTVEKPK